MVLRAGSSPGPYTQCGIAVPSEKPAVRWRRFPRRSALLPNRRALSPRKSLSFSFMVPYSREMMIVDTSLDCVGSQRPLWGTLVRIPRQLSLRFPYSRRVMIVLRRSLYGVVSDGHVYCLFVPLAPPVLIGITQEAKFGRNQVFAKFCFSVLCSSCFTQGTKAP